MEVRRINRNLRKGQSIASNPLGCCWFYHLRIICQICCHYFPSFYTVMKFTSVARLMGIFSPVSVGMSTMTPHNACDDDDDDDDDHGDCDAAEGDSEPVLRFHEENAKIIT